MIDRPPDQVEILLAGTRRATAGEARLDTERGLVVLSAGSAQRRPRLEERGGAAAGTALEGAVVSVALDDARASCEGDAGGPCRLVVAAPP